MWSMANNRVFQQLAMPPACHVFQSINIIWTALIEGQPGIFCAQLFSFGPIFFDKLF